MTPDDGGTVLRLRHFEMPNKHASDHEKGWSFFVGDRLAALAAKA